MSIEEAASAPVGTLLVTKDGFEAWRKVQTGKSGWLRQKPSAHSPDGWVGSEGPLVGWQGKGLRAWMYIVKLVAAKELYESKKNPPQSEEGKRSLRTNPRKSRQVNIIPGVPPGVEPIMGTLKSLFGCEVIEVHRGFYKSPDLRYSAVRESRREGASFTGWVVRDDTYLNIYSDPILRKEDAIREMCRWARRA